jgi:adhesin/invasin
VPLPVFYASEKQINIQCPNLAPGTAFTLIVDGPHGSSSPLSLIMQYATPGVFSLNGSGAGQGAVLIANSATIAMPHSDTIPSQPVKAGDYVSIYVSGLGAVSGELSNGEPAPLSPLMWVKAPVDVLIGGQKAAVTFAGLAPGFTGLYQVNAKVPGSTSAANSVSVQIVTSLPDLSVARSNIVTIAVAAAK